MTKRTAHNKCARKMDHKFETVDETKTHLIQQCLYCKGKNWKPRRN